MNRTENQYRIAIDILRKYKGNQPFHLYLKETFKTLRSGSSDRRFIRELCYSALRIKKALPREEPGIQILLGLILTSVTFDENTRHLLQTYGQKDWSQMDRMAIEERIVALKDRINVGKIFPLSDRISQQISREVFIQSHLTQPLIWIRVRQKYLDKVTATLKGAGVQYVNSAGLETAIGLEPSVKLEQVLEKHQGQYEVQDLSSQRTTHDLAIAADTMVWDCCAGSGGKTLAMCDVEPGARYFVSDNRPGILINLNKRFRTNRVSDYYAAVYNLSEQSETGPHFNRTGKPGDESIDSPEFDLILADVPCSGSGTWGRNPEWLSKFTPKDLEKYIELQREILTNAVNSLKPGGELVMITCSVYTQENEQNVQWLQDSLNLTLKDTKVFHGYENRADTMFRARLTKNPS